MPELATVTDIRELKHMIERQTLQLNAPALGGLVILGVGALAVLIRPT